MSETIDATPEQESLTPEQVLEKLRAMTIHTTGDLGVGSVYRVPGGWLYTLQHPGSITTTFVPES